MSDEKKRREQNSTAIKIRATLENLDELVDNIPNLNPEMKKNIVDKINEVKKDILPFVQDMVKSIFENISEKLGTGKDSKMWLLKNGKKGLQFWIMKNVTVINGELELDFPLQKIYDRIDKYAKPESLIGDTVSGKLFSLDDYEIETALPPAPEGEVKLIATVTDK